MNHVAAGAHLPCTMPLLGLHAARVTCRKLAWGRVGQGIVNGACKLLGRIVGALGVVRMCLGVQTCQYSHHHVFHAYHANSRLFFLWSSGVMYARMTLPLLYPCMAAAARATLCASCSVFGWLLRAACTNPSSASLLQDVLQTV